MKKFNYNVDHNTDIKRLSSLKLVESLGYFTILKDVQMVDKIITEASERGVEYNTININLSLSSPFKNFFLFLGFKLLDTLYIEDIPIDSETKAGFKMLCTKLKAHGLEL